MIPYFYLPTISLGPVTVNTWGLMVALGFLLATILAKREAKRRGLDPKPLLDGAFWIIIASMIGARLVHVFLYDWPYYREHLGEIVKIWHGGLSSYGGFAGGAMVGYVALKKYRAQLWSYADCIAWGAAPGWTVGRIGCFLIHDHPGTLTHFFLAVKQPDGAARHDLGLYDGLLSLFIFFVLMVVRRKKPRHGTLVLTLMGVYASVRFFLDFLRVTDVRYLGFTPAQYASVLMLCMVVWFVVKFKKLYGAQSTFAHH